MSNTVKTNSFPKELGTTKYEYKSFHNRLTDKELNELGADRWYLLLFSAVPDGKPKQFYLFMREKLV